MKTIFSGSRSDDDETDAWNLAIVRGTRQILPVLIGRFRGLHARPHRSWTLTS
jgi:hypothetical protein